MRRLLLTLAAVVSLAVATPVLPQSSEAPQPADVAELQQAASAGDVLAQVLLAGHYDTGKNVPQDFSRAAKWYESAAMQGNAAAQNRLGQLLRSGLGLGRDDVEAVKWLKLAADQGAPQHIFDLAEMYENGFGVSQDYATAAELYRQAAEGGLAEAAVNLAVLYQNGTGVAQDFERAIALYNGPAQAGHLRALNNLGLLYTKGQGVEQNYEIGAQLFQLAADKGFATAMTNLGVMYDNGFGVKQDDEQAQLWYRRAGQNEAETLDTLVQRTGFFFDPRLAPPDQSKDAFAAHLELARGGDPISQFLVGYMLGSSEGETRNLADAARWFRLAAEKGVTPAMANLGLLYFRGLGVPQDYVQGYMWFTLASTGGMTDIISLREAFTASMTTGQINQAQQMASARWQAAQE